MRTVSIIGGRPNVIKAASIHRSLTEAGLQHEIIDIGVYEKPYGKKIYAELELPVPPIILELPSTQDYLLGIKLLIAEISRALEIIKPDILLIYGDINPGVAASLSSANKGIPFVHIEAGLRNYDLNDTEEINRLVIDKFSKLLFCTAKAAKNNLLKEGFDQHKVFVVGNTIIHTLSNHLKSAKLEVLKDLGLLNKTYGLVTIHREENLTSPGRLDNIFKGINEIQQETPLIFIRYASTTKALEKNGYSNFESLRNLKIVNTLSYHHYLGLLKNAAFIITDSSGIQDESTYLGIPCIVCRESTHRIDTSEYGNSHLVSDNSEEIVKEVKRALVKKRAKASYPIEWDMDVGKSIATILIDHKEVFHG
jgi:UDP-N-acetylglucosamine 2-epimerase (non-hydrolysing)